MRDLGTETIETKRLTLRKFQANDAADMYYHYCSDPEVTRFMTWPAHRNLEITNRVLSSWLDQYDEKTYMWAIVSKDIHEVIGTISVTQMDTKAKSCEIAYAIGQNYWNQGYTTEALKAVMAFLFEQVGVNRIWACHDTRNPASGAVMKKCGMVYEGRLRQAIKLNAGIGDLDTYGILKSEWTKEA